MTRHHEVGCGSNLVEINRSDLLHLPAHLRYPKISKKHSKNKKKPNFAHSIKKTCKKPSKGLHTASGLKNRDTYSLKAIIKPPCGQIWTRLGQSEAPCFPYLLLGVLGGFWGQFRGVIRTNKDPEKLRKSRSKSLIKPFQKHCVRFFKAGGGHEPHESSRGCQEVTERS